MGKIMSVYTAVAIGQGNPTNPIAASRKVVPDSTARIMRDDHDEAMVCLTCTKKKCTGGRGCFAARKRQLAKEARS